MKERKPKVSDFGLAKVEDALPLEPWEWADRDGDLIGDNLDADADGDWWTDAEEATAGTDPLDRLSFPWKEEEKGSPGPPSEKDPAPPVRKPPAPSRAL